MSNIIPAEIISSLIINGDLSKLNAEQRVTYYRLFCERLGLDPLSQPFKILSLNGKQVLYCDRSGAQQLNKLHNVSHEIKSRETTTDLYIVTCRASLPDGRYTDSIGAVNVKGFTGDALANALMKGETKAKRRATMDLLGLGMLDETEVETIPNAKVIPDEIFQKSADELKEDYLFLLDQLEQVTGGYDKKLLPDNWKQEQNQVNFTKAIKHVGNLLEQEREVRRGLITPHTVEDIGKAVKAAADKDDFYVDSKKAKK